eukprot:m.204591 g.204591  ORF g.204591 m.204591 type:complete len:129 (-) comp15010_c0_seq25:75-461(-)
MFEVANVKTVTKYALLCFPCHASSPCPVVNLDMCDAGLHHCHRFASCTNEDRTSVKCTCNNGYLGDGTYCTPIFEADVDTHPLDLLDYQGMRQNQKRGTPRSKVQAYLSSTSYPILQLYRWLTYRTTA